MTRLMMYWSVTLSGASQVVRAGISEISTPCSLAWAARISCSLVSSSLAKTMIWPRSGIYSLPPKWVKLTARRLTMTRSSLSKVFSMLPPTTLYERKTKEFKIKVPTTTQAMKPKRLKMSLRIGCFWKKVGFVVISIVLL